VQCTGLGYSYSVGVGIGKVWLFKMIGVMARLLFACTITIKFNAVTLQPTASSSQDGYRSQNILSIIFKQESSEAVEPEILL
jgi:hypothetical protein